MKQRSDKREYVITDFGAKPEIGFDNQEFIQKAIDLCSKEGGGTVVIPQGYWLTSPIQLKSNVTLHTLNCAYVRFTKSKEKYPLQFTEFEGRKAIRAVSPISAVNAENIAITGEGIFDGSGDRWRPQKEWKTTLGEWNKKKTSKFLIEGNDGMIWYPTETSYLGSKNYVDETLPDALEKASEYYDWYRPVFVSLIHCEYVTLRGVTFTNSPAWTIHPLCCKHVTVDGCSVKNPPEAQNSDGIDVESCEDVVIKNCTFAVGDDAICMKAGKGRGARKMKAPTRNVEVFNCTVYHGHGGFVIGSEMSRGVKDVYVHDCRFIGTDTGIRIKSALGRGGYVKDIVVKNIVMSEIAGDCITISLNYGVKSFLDLADNITEYDNDDIPVIDGVKISDITCDSASRFLHIDGLQVSPVKNIAISNSNVNAENESSMNYEENVTFNNVTVNGKKFK